MFNYKCKKFIGQSFDNLTDVLCKIEAENVIHEYEIV